jgi:hypothetical protein
VNNHGSFLVWESIFCIDAPLYDVGQWCHLQIQGLAIYASSYGAFFVNYFSSSVVFSLHQEKTFLHAFFE